MAFCNFGFRGDFVPEHVKNTITYVSTSGSFYTSHVDNVREYLWILGKPYQNDAEESDALYHATCFNEI